MMMTNMFDLFDDLFYTPYRMPETGRSLMASEVREFDDHYELSMELAGFSREEIKAELKDGCLTIRAEHAEDNENGKVLRSERFAGTCQRSFTIDPEIRREDISASFDNGVLKLSIPKAVPQPETPEQYRIAIQ